jgi:hypothetical protein
MSRADVLIIGDDGGQLALKNVSKTKARTLTNALNGGALRSGLRAAVFIYGPANSYTPDEKPKKVPA